MKKLRLELDHVQVESFVTADSVRMRGTVRGRNGTNQGTCHDMGCNTGITAYDYCPTSEEETCNGWGGCPATSQDNGETCDGTCSDAGCTGCNAWC